MGAWGIYLAGGFHCVQPEAPSPYIEYCPNNEQILQPMSQHSRYLLWSLPAKGEIEGGVG